MKYLLELFFLTVLSSARSLKILGIFAHPGSTHFAVFQPLVEALSQRGHDVTVLGYFPLKKKIPRYRDVILKYPGTSIQQSLQFLDIGSETYEQYLGAHIIFEIAKYSCKIALTSSAYRDLLHGEEKFDLIISEFFNTNCLLLPFLEKLKIPFIGVTSHVIMPWSNDWVGNPDNPSYIPSLFSGLSGSLRFHQKVKNLLIVISSKLLEHGMDERIIKENLDEDFSMFGDVMYNTSLILSNSHASLHGARPLVPNVVEVGGIHLKKHKKLPGHIEKWINESTHGVIYFSLGSMIKGHTFPEEKRQMFVSAFSRLPQRIIWKWEADTMPGKPDNIMIEKWLPQFDILCHPNVKAFIAHGGLLGATEAVHCGVPMVIMPQFGDQFTNAKAIEASGGGVILDYSTLSEETIYNALTNVLDESFNNKAKELSARFRDRPLPPLETAIYWVEYVARHKGAPHLRTAAVGMPLYQYLLLDVIAFLATISFCFMFIVYYITRALFRKLFSRKKSSDKVKTN